MRVYSLKAFAGLTILSIAVGVVVVEFAYLGLDALYPYASTSSDEWGDGGVGWTKPYGKLTLTAFAVSPIDVELTLSLVNYQTSSYYNLTVWIADLNTSYRVGLPEGFELMSGSIAWNGSAATPKVNLEATIRAVKDGEWRLTGVALWYQPGASQSHFSGALEITVSNGKVTDIEKYEPEPQVSPRVKLQMTGVSDPYGICVSLNVDLENVMIRVTNGVAANYPPNQTVFFNDTMCGLRIDKVAGKGTWQTYMVFGEPDTSKLEPWESENVTISLDVFKEKGLYRAISEGWFEQNGCKVMVWAQAQFEVRYSLEE